MGYKRNPKVYDLKFDETTDYPGLEVQVRTLTMGQLAHVWSADGSALATYEMFVDRLVSWNLEDENGTPVPTTREAIEAEDDDLITTITKKWTQAVMGVPAPLVDSSSSGGTSPAESVLTEIPSESLAS